MVIYDLSIEILSFYMDFFYE